MQESDLDVWVVVNRAAGCTAINHPFIGGVKLDITFMTWAQLLERCAEERQRRERVPMLAESKIIFDKGGKLKRLKEQMLKVKPFRYTAKDAQSVQFEVYHWGQKVRRALLAKDDDRALLSMHMGLPYLLKTHYRSCGRWWVSDKRLMADLATWDRPLVGRLKIFLRARAVRRKFAAWEGLVEHILRPWGGSVPIERINCNCKSCQKDRAALVP